MQDFLKDRPVLTSQDATIVAPTPAAAAPGGGMPFARIVREGGAAPRPAAPAPAKPEAAGKPAAPAAAAHTSQVKTVVENGRITKIIVTCSCGKVTEIACQY
jgi:hypothetical protein